MSRRIDDYYNNEERTPFSDEEYDGEAFRRRMSEGYRERDFEGRYTLTESDEEYKTTIYYGNKNPLCSYS